MLSVSPCRCALETTRRPRGTLSATALPRRAPVSLRDRRLGTRSSMRSSCHLSVLGRLQAWYRRLHSPALPSLECVVSCSTRCDGSPTGRLSCTTVLDVELLSSVLEPVLLPWKLRRNDVQCCKCPFVRYPSRRSIMCSVDSRLFASRDRYVQGCFAERVNCNFKKIS